MGLRRKYHKFSDFEIYEIVKYIKELGDTEYCNICHAGHNCELKGRLAKHVLIEHYIPLALKLTSKIIYSKNRSELESVALLAIVRVVNKIPELKDISNFSSYVNRYIMLDLLQFIRTDGVIKLKNNNVTGNEKLRDEVLFVGFGSKYFVDNRQQIKLEIKEAISSVIMTTLEETVFNLLKEGYTTNDIAKKCNRSASQISQVKGRLMKKLREVLL